MTLKGLPGALRSSLVAFSALLGAAYAQSNAPLLTTPKGYCQLSAIAVATALSTCSGGIPNGANAAYIVVETTAARYRDDGVNPTASVGQPIALSAPLFYTGTLSQFVIIPQSATSTVDVLFYHLTAP